MNASLTILLPTLNESGNIRQLIHRLLACMPNQQIIVIDDSSTDGTPDLVKSFCSTASPVRLVERTGKPCLTASIQTGIETATTEFVAWMDADLSHPPELVPALLHAATSCGCCIATRYADDVRKSNSAREHGNLPATVLSIILNIIVRRILKLSITDYTSGFIVCRRSMLVDHPLHGDYGEYFIDLMYHLHQSGVSIGEISYTSPPRISGYSKTGTTLPKLFRRGYKYLEQTIALLMKHCPPVFPAKHLSYTAAVSICNMERHHCRPAAALHRTVLQTTFNARAGENYLTSLYETVSSGTSDSMGWIAYNHRFGIVGFITVSTDLFTTGKIIGKCMTPANWFRLLGTAFLHPFTFLVTLGKMFPARKKKLNRPIPAILTLCVHPQCQHNGIGNKLLDTCLSYCRSLRIRDLYVDTEVGNKPAFSFYLKNNFEEYGRSHTTVFLKRRVVNAQRNQNAD